MSKCGLINLILLHLALRFINCLLLNLLDDNILMLETDIQLYGAGTQRENSSLPVMAHDPPAFDYELTFEEWMKEVGVRV